LGITRHPKARTHLDAGFLHNIHDLVAQQRLKCIGRVQTCQFARVSKDRVALRHLNAIHLQGGYLAKGGGFAYRGEFRECKAVVFKLNAANVEGQAHGFGAAAVKIEIREFELGHGGYLRS
jgi:hypothetical protein